MFLSLEQNQCVKHDLNIETDAIKCNRTCSVIVKIKRSVARFSRPATNGGQPFFASGVAKCLGDER